MEEGNLIKELFIPSEEKAFEKFRDMRCNDVVEKRKKEDFTIF